MTLKECCDALDALLNRSMYWNDNNTQACFQFSNTDEMRDIVREAKRALTYMKIVEMRGNE
jgi:hypothetical protein